MREEGKEKGEDVIYVRGTCSRNHRDSYIDIDCFCAPFLAFVFSCHVL